MRFIFIFIIAFCSQKSLAQENRKRALDSFIMIGSTLSPKTESKFNFLGSTTSSTTSDKNSFSFGVDLGFRVSDRFLYSLLIENADYAYDNGGADDRLFFIGIAPKFEIPLGGNSYFWGGLGIGYLRNSISAIQEVQDNLLLTVKNPTAGTIGLSPRIGIDTIVSENAAIRLQMSYTSGEFDHEFNVKNYPSMTNIGDGTAKLKRTWTTIYLGLAWAI